MTQVALARKYRPKRFADLIGQEHVAMGLAGAVGKNRVAHAYLLTGPRGVGKTTAARILAMALNCERRKQADDSGEPCGECDSCTRTWSGSATLDVIEIDAASNRGVDDARDLRERAMYAASGANRHKVYIVDEAHMLTREAWNALLKILEEPPPQVVFVFATTDPQKIANAAAPVLSRLQRFDFRRLGPTAVADRLAHVAKQEGIATDADALPLIARVAAGGMRDALSLLDQALVFGDGKVTAAGVRAALGLIDDETYAELLGMLAERRSVDVFPFVARLVESGADLSEFVNGAGEVLRLLMLRIVGGADAGAGSEAARAAVEKYAHAFTAGDVLRLLKLLAECENAIRRSPNARLHVETLLLQWTLMDRTVELSEVMEAMGGSPRTARPEPQRQAPVTLRDVEAKAPIPEPITGDLSLSAVQARWPEVLNAVAKKNRMLREALAHAAPAALADDTLHLAVDGMGDVDGLDQRRPVIAEAVAQVTGRKLRITIGAAAGAAPVAAPEPVRLDPKGDRDERLRLYRAKDKSLDTAADLLDLELTE
ncbi:MAG: DNA polymerase III subunit gamma/tau [Gemmatimonadetes bacterium]|nr:DNA polymerase III subunit gamma/tau [Gemmatimonadota bacterium]